MPPRTEAPEFSPKFLKDIDLRNSVTRSLDIAGAEVLHHKSPGITIVEFPHNGENVTALWFNDRSEPDKPERGFFTLEGLSQFQENLSLIAKDHSLAGIIFTDNLPEESKVSFYGIDIKNVFGPIFEKLSHGDTGEMEALLRQGQRISEKIYSYSKPFVAAARRLAVGGGFEFMIPAHHIVQGQQASYSLPECQLDVPTFIRDRAKYDLQLGNPNYRNGKVLFPGWIGNVLLYDKLSNKAEAHTETVTQVVEEFTFNGKMLSATEASILGLADKTVESDSDIIPTAADYITDTFWPLRVAGRGLHLPNVRPENPAVYDTPGKIAGADLLYHHSVRLYPDFVVAERAVELMIDAMWYGLSVKGSLPYHNDALFKQLG